MVSRDIGIIYNWLKHDKLSLNYNKNHYMLIAKQKIPLDFDMEINILTTMFYPKLRMLNTCEQYQITS